MQSESKARDSRIIVHCYSFVPVMIYKQEKLDVITSLPYQNSLPVHHFAFQFRWPSTPEHLFSLSGFIDALGFTWPSAPLLTIFQYAGIDCSNKKCAFVSDEIISFKGFIYNQI